MSVCFNRQDFPVLAKVDGDHIHQLLLNLILNALDVMPHGGTLIIDLHAPEGDHIELRVLDTGPGISSDLLPRLFRPFVSTKETGLGLGLSVCRRIVEAHGGAITAGDRPAGGAVFTVTLPLRPATRMSNAPPMTHQ